MVHCVRVIHTQGYGKAKAVRISKSEDLPVCMELPSVTEYDTRYKGSRVFVLLLLFLVPLFFLRQGHFY